MDMMQGVFHTKVKVQSSMAGREGTEVASY